MKSLFKNIIVAILTLEAKLLLKRTRPQIIAITGSVGKTSVKDAIFEVVKGHIHARKSEKSFNSEIGVPLSILGLESGWNNPLVWMKNIFDGAFIALHPGDYPRLLVLEMGVDRPGDMDKLTSWIRPDIVVLTRLPDIPVHVEYFKSPEEVIQEKRKLVDALKPDGVLVYNQDDEKVVEIANGILQRSVGYSRYSLSPYTASNDSIVYDNGRAVGFEFTLTHLQEVVRLRVTGSLGVQHAYNYAAAVAVGAEFNVRIEDAVLALSEHVPPPGRMRLLRGIKDTLIIDDTYNSSPIASERSLQTLAEMRGVKRRIAVLGDMLELGQYSMSEHERIGRIAADSSDLLITVGVRAQGIAKGAIERGMNERMVLQYENSERAGKELEKLLTPGDIILVKGSQSIRAERIVEEIMAEPLRAEELLVRQGKAWRDIA